MKKFPPAFHKLLQRSILGGCLALIACSAYSLQAQSPQGSVSDPTKDFSASELEELLGPIALYPDALIALILPASTVPTDVTLAARSLDAGLTPDQIDSQPWDDSVKSLTRYPDIIQWLDENLEWTASLGDAFFVQPSEVMNTLQTLRKRALAAGHLTDTPQQSVVEETVDGTTYLRIVPAEPTVIYVPAYDPQIVYYATPSYFVGNVISFGVGFSLGSWLNYDCDWGRREIYCGAYRSGWNKNWSHLNRRNGQGGRSHVVRNSANINVVNISSQSARPWNPSARSRQQTERQSTIRPSQREPATTATRSRFSTASTRSSNRPQTTLLPNSRPTGNSIHPLRVDPPPRLNQTVGNPTLSSGRNRQISSQTINSPVLDSNGNRDVKIHSNRTQTQAPPHVRRDLIVPSHATSPSVDRETNRRTRSTAPNPSPRSQPTDRNPVGFNHSRFRTVQPALAATQRHQTVNGPNANPHSSSRFQPQTQGASRFQNTRANLPSRAIPGGSSFSQPQPTFQGAGQNQRSSGGARNR